MLVSGAMLLLPGCDGGQVARAVLPMPSAEDRLAATEALDELCDKSGGTHIHRVVENVAGFEYVNIVSYANGRTNPHTDIALAGCVPECINFLGEGFSYVEATLREPSTAAYLIDFAENPGTHRYELVSRPHPGCDRYDYVLRERTTARAAAADHAEALQGKCVVATPVGMKSSLYVFEGSYNEPVVLPGLSRKQVVNSFGSRVLDRKSGGELATRVSYHFRDYGVVGGNQYQCGDVFRMDVTTVLKPVKP